MNNVEDSTEMLESVNYETLEEESNSSVTVADIDSSVQPEETKSLQRGSDSLITSEDVNGSNDNISVSSNVSSLQDGDDPKRPSVRELAKQFGTTANVVPAHLRKITTQPKIEVVKKSSRKRDPKKFYESIPIDIVEVTHSTKQPAPAPVHSLTARNLSKSLRADLRIQSMGKESAAAPLVDQEQPRPAERHRANLEFWRALEPSKATPTPAPRQPKK